MYGTSEMRAITLNNGGSYAETYNATELTPVSNNILSVICIKIRRGLLSDFAYCRHVRIFNITDLLQKLTEHLQIKNLLTARGFVIF